MTPLCFFADNHNMPTARPRTAAITYLAP